MANRVKVGIFGVLALVMVLGLLGAGILTAQSSLVPPANPLPAPLVAGWQPNTGEVAYVLTLDQVRGTTPEQSLATELGGVLAPTDVTVTSAPSPGGTSYSITASSGGRPVGEAGILDIAMEAGGLSMAEVQALVDDTPLADLQGQVTGSQIPGSITRDSEYTNVSARNHLGLTEFETLSLFTGAGLVDSTLTFSQNDGGEVTITLPMGEGGMMDQRVLNPDHASGSMDTLGDIQIDPQGKVFSTVPVPEGGVAGVGTFVRFDHPDYIGAFPGDPNELSVPLGTYYFETTNHKLRVTVNNAQGTRVWQDADWGDILPANAQYRGNHDTDDDALFHLRMDGDVYHRDTGSRGIRQVSNFTAPVTPHIVYDAQRLAFFEDIPLPKRELFVERSSLPDPTADGAPDLVYLTHDHSEGARADAVITVGFTSSGVAGYSRGDLSSTLGNINTESPLLEVFGLVVQHL